MQVRLLFFLVFIYCLAAGKLRAQKISDVFTEKAGNFSVRLLDVQNGLPQGYVNGIVQDKVGFIWVGTRDGLARYDGYKVKVFRYDPVDSGTIASNVIQTIYSDRENNIWILYENNAVDIFDPVTEKVTHLTPGRPLGWLAAERHQYSFYLHEDKTQRYWIVSSTLKRLQYFTRGHPDPVNIPVPPGEKILALEEDQQGAIWTCTNRALYVIQHGRFHKISALPEQPIYNRGHISSMIEDKRGNWLIRNEGCIEIYHPDGRWTLVKTPYATSKTLQYFISMSPNGDVYFNSAGHIYQLHTDHTISSAWANPNRPYDFFAMMVDRSGVLWAGMDTFGAVLINLTSRGFHSYPYQNGFVMDVLTRWFQLPFSKKAKKNVDSYLPRTAFDRKGRLWLVGTPFLTDVTSDKKKQLHVFLLDGQQYTPRFFNFPSLGWLQIAFDEGNDCWGIIKHDTLGKVQLLVKVDLSNGIITPVLKIYQPYYAINYLCASGHNLCIVYNNGLQLYNTITGKSVVYTSKEFFGNVSLLLATPDPGNRHILWISTMGNGLIRFNTENGKVKAFTEKNGIPSNTVYAALADKRGYLWCSSNQGIFRFNPLDNTLLSFTASDGLQGNEFNRYHFMETADGGLLFGGTQGWTYFHPDSIHIDNFHPPSAITDILVNNTVLAMLPQWKDSAVNALHALKLLYNQNFITFTFSGLEFSNPDKLQYRYRLQGFDKDWVEVGSQHMANYTNLSPGEYLFQVNASNKADSWSHEVKALRIVILPPWWETWWAYFFYGIIVITAGYFFYRNRMKRLRIKHAMILKEKEAAHLKQVDEMKSRFFSNITHEFRTPLSLIIGPLDQINKNNTKISPGAKKIIAVAQRNAKQLLHLINQLLDMSKMESGSMAVVLSRGELGTFVADQISLFYNQAQEKNIRLTFENTVKGEFLFDADKWQKILSNLLSNAIKFSSEGDSVNVHLAVDYGCHEAGSACLTISDTGIGIIAEKLPFVFDRFYQADNSSTRIQGGVGIGLALTKELAELMNGSIEVKSECGKGTIFSVMIPVNPAINKKVPAMQNIRSEVPVFILDRQKEESAIVQESEHLILIAEDNVELNRFIAYILGQHYRILTTFNGKGALQTVNENLPDVIISDIMMPEMDGYAFCKAIKQSVNTDHIAFIMLSARSSQDNIIRGLKYAADDYITKPFSPEELLLRVRNQIDRQRRLRNFFKKQLMQPDEKPDFDDPTDPFLQRLYDFIEQNIDNADFSVEMLANEVNMSSRTLNRKLEMITGLSITKMIRQYRLRKAASLLQSGYRVSEVAYNTGFESPFYFSAAFKEFYGMAPSKYAKQQRVDFKKSGK